MTHVNSRTLVRESRNLVTPGMASQRPRVFKNVIEQKPVLLSTDVTALIWPKVLGLPHVRVRAQPCHSDARPSVTTVCSLSPHGACTCAPQTFQVATLYLCACPSAPALCLHLGLSPGSSFSSDSHQMRASATSFSVWAVFYVLRVFCFSRRTFYALAV